MSKKPRVQRKRLWQAPLHRRRRHLRVRLSKELREQYKRRNIVVKKGDRVRILRGDFEGKEGKVERVSYKHYRLFVEGVVRKNAKGEERPVPVHPSNVEIIELLMDKDREVKLNG